MRNLLFVLILIFAVALSGCSGSDSGEKAKPEQTPAPVKTETPQATPTPEETQGGNQPPSSGEVYRTLYEMYVNKKMVHITYTVDYGNRQEIGEGWFYYDADKNQKLFRMQGNDEAGFGAVIIIETFSGNTKTTTLYSKGSAGMQPAEGCDWIKVTQTMSVSPSDYENLGDEPVDQSVKVTISEQGQMVYEYNLEYVDFDPAIFQPDGKVCDVMVYSHGGG